jgi:HD-like signal output (HDOD) protein
MAKPRCELSAGEMVDLYDWIGRKLDRLGIESQPEVATRLLELCSDPNAGLNDFSSVIRTDPALTGRVLRVSNAAFYAQSKPVSSIDRACVLIGAQRLKAIALGFYLSRSAAEDDQALTREIWGQSVYRACLASELATRIAPDHIAEAFIISLMIDSGTPLLNKMCPAEMMRVRMQSLTPAKQFKAEMETMPCTHVDVVTSLGRRWKFPDLLLKPIEWHHTVPKGSHDGDPMRQLHRIAYYVGCVPIAPDGKPEETAPLASLANRHLGIDPAALAEAFTNASKQYDAAFEIFRDVADNLGDVTALAEAVHNRLVDALDDTVIELLRQESSQTPVTITLQGGTVELLKEEDGYVQAILQDHQGKALTSHRFQAGSESADILVESLGLDEQNDPDLKELGSALERFAA